MEKNAKQLCLEVNRPDNERVPYDSVEETLSEGNRLGKLYSTVYSGRFCPHCKKFHLTTGYHSNEIFSNSNKLVILFPLNLNKEGVLKVTKLSEEFLEPARIMYGDGPECPATGRNLKNISVAECIGLLNEGSISNQEKNYLINRVQTVTDKVIDDINVLVDQLSANPGRSIVRIDRLLRKYRYLKTLIPEFVNEVESKIKAYKKNKQQKRVQRQRQRVNKRFVRKNFVRKNKREGK